MTLQHQDHRPQRAGRRNAGSCRPGLCTHRREPVEPDQRPQQRGRRGRRRAVGKADVLFEGGGDIGPDPHGGHVAHRQRVPRRDDDQRRSGTGFAVGEGVEPAPHRRAEAPAQVREERGPHHRVDVRVVVGRERVFDRRRGIAIGRVPLARPPVQLRCDHRLLVQQLGAQQLAQQVVHAVVRTAPVGSPDEQVLVGELAQHARGIGAPEHRVTQGRFKLLQDRGAQQEQPVVVGEVAEHFVAQVAGQRPVVAREAQIERARLAGREHRHPREIHGDRPPLGTGHGLGEITGIAFDAHLPQDRRALRGRQQQPMAVEPPQGALGLQPLDPERRFGAGSHDELPPRRDRVHEDLEHRTGALRTQHVRVVEDQHTADGTATQELREGRERDAGPVELPRQDPAPGRRGDRFHLVERVEHRAEQDAAVVVARAEAQAGDRPRLALTPLVEQRGLAVPRAGDDQDDRRILARAQVAQQPLAHHRLSPRLRHATNSSRRHTRNDSAWDGGHAGYPMCVRCPRRRPARASRRSARPAAPPGRAWRGTRRPRPR